jgi:hypothetical protein
MNSHHWHSTRATRSLTSPFAGVAFTVKRRARRRCCRCSEPRRPRHPYIKKNVRMAAMGQSPWASVVIRSTPGEAGRAATSCEACIPLTTGAYTPRALSRTAHCLHPASKSARQLDYSGASRRLYAVSLWKYRVCRALHLRQIRAPCGVCRTHLRTPGERPCAGYGDCTPCHRRRCCRAHRH